MTRSLSDKGSMPFPAGATEVTEWTDAGHPDEFRCFNGPTRTLPELRFGDQPAFVTIFGTQLRDGTVEGRCIRVAGVHWDDELDSKTARHLAQQLLDAADDLDRLGVQR